MMIRKYLQNHIIWLKDEINDIKSQVVIDADDLKTIAEIEADIKELKKSDREYDRIYLNNDITIYTLKKVLTNSYHDYDQYAVDEQPFENLDNGFITPELLEAIINIEFKENSNGGFKKSMTTKFGSRSKIRYIRGLLVKILDEYKEKENEKI